VHPAPRSTARSPPPNSILREFTPKLREEDFVASQELCSSSTRARTPEGLAFNIAPTYRWVLASSMKIPPQRKTKFCNPSSRPHHRSTNHHRLQHVRHIFRGREKDRVGSRRDASLESAPVIAGFARQYDVLYNRLFRWNSVKIRSCFGKSPIFGRWGEGNMSVFRPFGQIGTSCAA
jgi:hypothetical protein